MFLLWLHAFILSGVISPLICSSIFGTYPPGEFLFQYPIILPSHTVHGVLKARLLKWFAIPFSSGPHSVRPVHHDPSILGGPTWHGLLPRASLKQLHKLKQTHLFTIIEINFLMSLEARSSKSSKQRLISLESLGENLPPES